MKKISFDFDGCLKDIPMVKLLLTIVAQCEGVELYVITSRNENGDNSDMNTIEMSYIDRENIIFTNGELKAPIIKELDIDMHFDNDPHEVLEIQKLFGSPKAFLITDDLEKMFYFLKSIDDFLTLDENFKTELKYD